MAWYFFKQLIEGLEVIHGRGYVHRDIKLENLMVSFEGNRGEVPVLKIIDFGKAARLDGNI
jgi:serine/threonine protein kinase